MAEDGTVLEVRGGEGDRGAPEMLVSDSGGVFLAKQAQRIYAALGIDKRAIEQGRPWQNYIEANFGTMRRMADYHFARATSWAELHAIHDRFFQALRQSWCCRSARFPSHCWCPVACPVPPRYDAEHQPLLPFALGQTAKITAPRLAQSQEVVRRCAAGWFLLAKRRCATGCRVSSLPHYARIQARCESPYLAAIRRGS